MLQRRIARHGALSLALATTGLVLAACGGGGSTMPLSRAPNSVGMASVTIRIDAPNTTSSAASAAKRRPAYLSAATQSITISVNGGTPVAQNLTSSGGNCSTPSFGATPVCTLVSSAPVGSDAFTFVTYDAANGTGNVLSRNTVVQAIVAGQVNTVAVTLDGVPTGVLAYPYPGQSNVLQQAPSGYILMGTTPADFFVVATDADKNFIIGPGAPTLTVTSSSGNLKVASVANNPNEFVLTPLVEGVPVTLNVSAAGGNGGTSSGSVAIALKALPPTSLPATLYVFDEVSGVGEVDVFPAGSVNTVTPSARLSSLLLNQGPGSLAFGPGGNLFAEGNTDNGPLVVEYTAAQLAAGSGTPAVVVQSYYYNLEHSLTPNPKAVLEIGSLAVDSKGDLFVIGTYNGSSTEYLFEFPAGYTPTTNATVIPSSPTGITSPTLLYIDSNDNLYVANQPANETPSILVFSAENPATAPVRTIGASSGSNAGFTSVGSMAVGADGTLTVMDGTTFVMYTFAPGATNNPTPESSFQSPAEFFFGPMTVDPNDNIYGFQLNIGSPNTYQLDAYPAGSTGVGKALFSVESSYFNPSALIFAPGASTPDAERRKR